MNKIKLSLFSVIFFSFCSISQEDYAFFYLDESNVSIYSENKGNFKEMFVTLNNASDENVNIIFPPGGVFLNSNEDEQDLVIIIGDKINLDGNESDKIKIYTVCASPGKKSPSYGNDSWDYSWDERIAHLLNFYNSNRSMVELATGAEFHETFEKRHNFLQMCVWVFYDAKKSDVLNFATRNIFEGDKEKANSYFDLFYPTAVTFVTLYKGFYNLGKN